MIAGFKTGPRTWEEGKRIVEENGARMAEIWFRVDRASEHEAMFTWFARRDVRLGLHHWSVAAGNLKANLSTANAAVREESLQSVKQTIEIGRQLNCAYVNIHPGAERLERLDLDHGEQDLTDDEATAPEEARELMLAAAAELYAYAQKQEVLLTIETLPGIEAHDSQRQGRYDPGNTPLLTMQKIAKLGPIANDITHTAAAVAHEQQSAERDVLWAGLLEFTQATQQQTRLLHVNTMVPPFDGTDSHNGLLPEDEAAGVFPNREQVAELLALFRGRDDVFLVPEPRERMQENYRALIELIR